MHALGGFAHNRQSDAGPWIRLRRIQLLKHSKQARLRVFINADAVVLKPKSHLVAERLAPHYNTRSRALPHKLHCVVQKIGDALG
jgi:hypothetical protein